MNVKAILSVLVLSVILSKGKAQPVMAQQIKSVEQGIQKGLIIDPGKTARLTINERMRALKINGMSVAVVNNGKIAWAKGYGVRDASVPNETVDTNTLFQCASIGKIITAVAALQLVKEKRITLDEDINLKLTSWKLPENSFTRQKKVTLRMLLSHAAGLDDGYGFEGYYPSSKLPSVVQVLEAEPPANNKKKVRVAELPGTSEKYSGGGFLIIQQLIEDLTGSSFGAYADRIIFKPLSMVHTTYVNYPESFSAGNFARGHEDNGKIDPKRKYNIYPEAGAAGPWTTPSDLAKLVIALQQISKGEPGMFLDSSLVHRMLEPQINAMGLGVHLKGSKDVAGFWHAGNNAGYTGMLFGLNERGQGAVILTNSNAGEWMALEVARSIAEVYNWPIMRNIVSADLPDPAKYTGTYKAQGMDAARVGVDQGKLYFQKLNGKQRFNLYPSSTSGIFVIAEKPDNISFVFEMDAGGTVTGLTVYENGGHTSVLTK